MVALAATSCSGRADIEEIQGRVDNLLTRVNVTDATAIYYKGADSRADGENGYFKLDINGNEVKLEFADADGKTHDIPILWVVKASPRYMFFQPETGYLRIAVLSPINTDGFTEEDDQAVWDACSITCIADRTNGKLYKIPQINLNTSPQPVEHNGRYYIPGEDGQSYGEPCQIYEFDPNSLSVKSLLPEGQPFTSMSVNREGFIAYARSNGFSSEIKVKCPGGGLKLLGDGRSLMNINKTFYTINNDNIVYRWIPNGTNNMTSEPVSECPQYISMLYDSEKDVMLFPGYDTTWKFDGTAFSDINVVIPADFFNYRIVQTQSAWYSGASELTKLSKSDYSTSTIDLSNYQILSMVDNPDGADLTFTGIRYSDAKKVIGKIRPDNTVTIESAQSSNSNIYNLIPIN